MHKPPTKYVVESFVNFLTVGSLHDACILDVHAASDDQQNAVACGIAHHMKNPSRSDLNVFMC